MARRRRIPRRCWRRGGDVVLVIDVQGARQVRSRGIETVGIFVLPPSAAILEQRLRGRCRDTEDQIRERLEAACREVDEFTQYEHVVVNDELETAASRLGAIVLAERTRVRCMRGAARRIIETFKGRRNTGKVEKLEDESA